MNQNPYSTPKSFDVDKESRKNKSIPSRWNRWLGLLTLSISLSNIVAILISDLIQINLSIAELAILWFWLPGILMLLVTLTMVIVNAGRHNKFDWIWFGAFFLQFIGLLLTINSPSVSAVLSK